MEPLEFSNRGSALCRIRSVRDLRSPRGRPYEVNADYPIGEVCVSAGPEARILADSPEGEPTKPSELVL